MWRTESTATTWLMWTAVAAGVVVLVAIALWVIGARQWAALMRVHTGQLNAALVGLEGLATSSTPTRVRFDIRELEALPAPVQRYFRTVLKDGQPIVAAATIEMAGTINMSATAEQWKSFTSQQRVINAVVGLPQVSRPGFLWNAQVRMWPGVSAHVEDSYIVGQGRLIAKLLGLFTVAHAQGDGEMARGEFMRYFAETPWYPTALLPSQGVRWQAVDDTSAHATLVDGPITLTLLVRFNEAGLIASVRAEARGAGVGKDMVMLPWDCAFSDYQLHSGMLIPMTGEAAWVRPEGRKAYFVGKIKVVSFEFSP